MAAMAGKTDKKQTDRTVAHNKRAYHEYHVLETFKAGMVLTGTEIKSIRAGKVGLTEGFARIRNGEVYLYGVHIAPYEQGTHYNHEPLRTRKLLLTKKEIKRLIGKLKESGLTLVPLKMYFDRCWVKVDIGLCKGKKLYDKRDAIAAKDTKRDIDRAMKQRTR